MLQSKVILVKELSKLLLVFPDLVRKLEQKDPMFLTDLFRWMDHAEQVLKQHRITGVSELAGLRSRIVSPVFDNDTREPLRKRQIKVAAEQMYALQACISDCLEPVQQRMDSSRELVRQLLAMLSDSRAVQFEQGTAVDDFIRRIWWMLSQHEQLRAHAVQLKSHLSEPDIHLLINGCGRAEFCPAEHSATDAV